MEFRKKTTAILIAILMISTLAVAIPVSAEGVTWYVDDSVATTGDGTQGSPFKTITEGIDAAGTNDFIEVETGTYVEDLVILDTKTGLELKPATDATVTIEGTAYGAYEGMPSNILIEADGVKIHGFTIQSPNVLAGQWSGGIILTGTNIEIYENYFVSTGAGSCVAIQTLSSKLVPYTSDISGLDIHDNDFSGTPASYIGVYINPSAANTALITVTDNDFTGNMIGGVVMETNNAEITGNTIITDLTWAISTSGIYIKESIDQNPQSDILISSNTIKGSGTEGFKRGIRIGYFLGGQVLTNIIVTGNTVEDSQIGILVHSSASGVTVNYNDILGNDMGVENTVEELLDATLNWWGDATGPYHATTNPLALGDEVSDNVDYLPWVQGSVALTGTVTGHTLIVTADTGGTVTIDPIMTGGYDVVEVTLTAVPDAGYEFTEWTGSLPGLPDTVNPLVFTITSDVSVHAVFTELPKVSITAAPADISLTGQLGTTNTLTQLVTVTNNGDLIVDVTATLDGIDVAFFKECLTLDALIAPSTWPYDVCTNLAPTNLVELNLGLDLSSQTVKGTYSATLVFWAEETV